EVEVCYFCFGCLRLRVQLITSASLVMSAVSQPGSQRSPGVASGQACPSGEDYDKEDSLAGSQRGGPILRRPHTTGPPPS
ncbi:unnamed protein product, partial [Amoebophrya sp. A120]